MAKKPGSVKLGELDYLRLTHARDKVSAVLAEAQAAVRAAAQAAEQQVQAAREAFVTQLQVTAGKYGFDPTVNHLFDDERRTLTPSDDDAAQRELTATGRARSIGGS